LNSLDKVSEPENRYAFVTSPFEINGIFKLVYKNGLSSISITDESVSPMYLGFVMHVSLKDIIPLKLSQIHESGGFLFFLQYMSLEKFKTKPQEIGPQVLTLEHLRVGFILIFGLLALSVLAFVAECTPMLMKKVMSPLKKLFDACFSCYVVVKFVRMKRIL
jgi:hypothetical protein